MQDITFNVQCAFVKFSLLIFFGFHDEGNVVQGFLVFIFVSFFKNNVNETG